MIIAFYLRLSIADGDLDKDNKDESNSIENQRILLQSYLLTMELSDAEVVEYIDDGYSGLNFNRPAFGRMIEDAKNGKVDMILVKDLSRLGRDYIGVGDYLEQIFPVLGIRFVAVNSHYDSNNYIGRTMGLEMSMGNLINTLYCKDISKKLKTALQTKWKQGVSTVGRLPFGYIKDKNYPRKWLIDPEASKYVRLIFDLALKGYSTKMITEHLNENKIPTPGQYREMKTGGGAWSRVVSDEEWLWENSKVWRILKTYAYTGALVQGQSSSVRVGGKERRSIPKRDQFIVENTHEGIVTKEEFEKAQCVFRNMNRNMIRKDGGHILGGKVRCGNCNLLMLYQNTVEKVILCRHKMSSGKMSSCRSMRYDAKRIEGQVWFALRQQMALFEKVTALAEKVRAESSTDLAAEKRELSRTVEDRKAARVRAYENYVEGHLDKDQYLRQKNQLTDEIQKLNYRLAFLNGETDTADELFHDISEVKKTSETMRFDKLTREAVQAFVDVVYIHDVEHIEIKFLFDDLIERTVAYTEEHQGAPAAE